MKIEITVKRILGILAVIAWIATFIQAFNGIWSFWPFPNNSVVGYSGQVYLSFNWFPWASSALLSGIVATIITIVAANWRNQD